ncbi:MAG: hypothetical protein LRZ88_07500 [Candidatus Cloacimonetes bacterium]|nr:hypothetical protein [Candidatus Cloacimonadota bacterium]
MFKRVFLVSLLLLCIYVVLLSAKSVQEYVLTTDLLDEASGLATSVLNPDILYAHNDSGGENAVFAIDTKGRLQAKIIIDGVKNRDWEDIATAVDIQTGTPYIYIGEIGDNGARYPSVSIYKVPEPSLAMGDT